MANRGWNPVETRLVAEYVARRWPDALAYQRVRVGPLPESQAGEPVSASELRMLGVWRRWVDAVVVLPGECILIEAAVKPEPGHVAQLELYMDLWPQTTEFAQYLSRPARGLLVFAVDDPGIHALVRRRGYTMDIFCPPWVRAYLLDLYPRQGIRAVESSE
jgi:hypothetical protein